MEKKIVLINQTSGFLIVDDLNAYCNKYKEVHLICGELCLGQRKLNDQVIINHICKYNKSSSFKRISTWIFASIQIFFLLLFKYHKWDIIYYTNPPMACFASLILNNTFSIVEYDIYPDALSTIGISEGNLIYKFWRYLKCKLYKKAKKIFTLSEGMKSVLMKYGSESKIKVIPLWSASEDFKPISKKDNIFIKKYNIEDKFIVLYSGNIGYTHNVECLIEVAKRMQYDNDILFLIIGEGKKKQDLQNEVSSYKLSNVIFLPFQEFKDLPYSLAAADVGVITLDDNVSKVSVPSKIFNLLAVGAPLLAISNEDTEMYSLISKYNNGKCISKNKILNMISFINELKNNPDKKKEYSDNSLIASQYFTYRNADFYLE